MRGIGCHIPSSRKSFSSIPLNISTVGFQVAQVFIGDPKTYNVHKFDPQQIARFREERGIHKTNIYVHAPYVLHAFAKPENKRKNNAAIRRHLQECVALGIDGYVLHMGGTKQFDEAIEANDYTPVYKALEELCSTVGSEILAQCPILLENCASGNIISGSPDAIKNCIIYVNERGFNVGMCLDTLHLYSWGYNLMDGSGPFLSSILSKIKLIHLNSGPQGITFGCRRDRHASILDGCISREVIVKTLYALQGVPIILERDNLPSVNHESQVVRLIDAFATQGLPVEHAVEHSFIPVPLATHPIIEVLGVYSGSPEVI